MRRLTSGNISFRYLVCKINYMKDISMKQLFASYIFSRDELYDSMPITDEEFKVSLFIVIGALVLFGLIIHLF
jgi:hypothetical protein